MVGIFGLGLSACDRLLSESASDDSEQLHPRDPTSLQEQEGDGGNGDAGSRGAGDAGDPPDDARDSGRSGRSASCSGDGVRS